MTNDRPLAELIAELEQMRSLKVWSRVTALEAEIKARTAKVELPQDSYYYGTAADLQRHPLVGQTVQWLAYKPITSGGCSNEVEIRTGRVFMVKPDVYNPETLVAYIKPTNAFDANSKVLVNVEDLEVLS